MDSHKLMLIVEKCINGDKDAFRTIVGEYSDYVYAIAFRVLGSSEDARDMVQETFIKVWRNIEKYKPAVKFSTWLYTIATNLCIDKLREQKRAPLDSYPESGIPNNLMEPEIGTNSIDYKQLEVLIAKMTGNLPPMQKMVFVLKDIEGLSSDEIEQITGMTKEQIKSNLHYARKEIKSQLIKVGYEMH
jgi:RNA polymerase sigma-70 factor, ECF subfamily